MSALICTAELESGGQLSGIHETTALRLGRLVMPAAVWASGRALSTPSTKMRRLTGVVWALSDRTGNMT